MYDILFFMPLSGTSPFPNFLRETFAFCFLLHFQNIKRFLDIRKNLNVFLKCSLILYPKLNTKEILQYASE